MKLFLVPPPMVMSFMDDVHPDIQECIANSHNEWKMEWLLAEILRGQYGLWVLTDGEKYGGCVVTEILATNAGTWLNVMFIANHEGLKGLLFIMEVLESEVKKSNWRGLKYMTSLDGFASFAERTGFKPRFIEYVKEVE